MTITPHERAMQKAWADFYKNDILESACKTYLQALLDDAETVETIIADHDFMNQVADNYTPFEDWLRSIAKSATATLKRMGGMLS